MISKLLGPLVLGVTIAFSGPAAALTLNFSEANTNSSNTPATGASGSVDFSFVSIGGGGDLFKVDITVTNTTGVPTFGAGATNSKLTGFGFDLLGSTTFGDTLALGSFLDTVLEDASLPPFGTADIGLADNSNFQGGGPNGALPVGQSDTVSLAFEDSSFNGDAGALEAAMLEGFNDGSLIAFLRFQDVNAGAGSEKLLFTGGEDVVTPPVNPIPLPAAGWMLLAGLGGLAAMGRRKKG